MAIWRDLGCKLGCRLSSRPDMGMGSFTFVSAMQTIRTWTADFGFENIAKVVTQIKACNAFEISAV
jgi:hypothetical protein